MSVLRGEITATEKVQHCVKTPSAASIALAEKDIQAMEHFVLVCS